MTDIPLLLLLSLHRLLCIVLFFYILNYVYIHKIKENAFPSDPPVRELQIFPEKPNSCSSCMSTHKVPEVILAGAPGVQPRTHEPSREPRGRQKSAFWLNWTCRCSRGSVSRIVSWGNTRGGRTETSVGRMAHDATDPDGGRTRMREGDERDRDRCCNWIGASSTKDSSTLKACLPALYSCSPPLLPSLHFVFCSVTFLQ